MATRKASLLVLFFVSVIAAHFADSTLLSLMLILIWPQVFDRTWRSTQALTKDRQKYLLKLALASLPLVLLMGGLVSFFSISAAQSNLQTLLLSVFGGYFASLLMLVFLIFPIAIKVNQQEYKLTEVLVLTLQQIKFHRKNIFLGAAVFCLLLSMSYWVAVELSVILSLALTSLFMAHRFHWHQLQPQDSA